MKHILKPLTGLFVAGLCCLCSTAAHAIEMTSFEASVTRAGKFEATVQFDASDPTCTIILRGGTSADNAAEGSAITSINVLSPSINWQRTIKRKAAANPFIVAQLVCSEGVTNSSAVSLKAKKITSSKKALTSIKWLQALSRKFHD